VRWNVAGNIIGAWIFTFPGAGMIAMVAYALVRWIFK
jgi:PiT family inorganic phosphate transporter